MTSASNKLPWREPPLNKWSIVGMNHYHVKGEKYLFVAMSMNDKLIKAEGQNQLAVLNKLAKLASTPNIKA